MAGRASRRGGTASMPKIAEETRAARRDQIIAAAVACFARAGYHATTMADVAARAGVSKGTPYLYLESKEALFLALHEEWDCGVADRVNAAIAALPQAWRRSPRQVLGAVAAAVAAHVLEETETCRVLMEARALAAHEPAPPQRPWPAARHPAPTAARAHPMMTGRHIPIRNREFQDGPDDRPGPEQGLLRRGAHPAGAGCAPGGAGRLRRDRPGARAPRPGTHRPRPRRRPGRGAGRARWP